MKKNYTLFATMFVAYASVAQYNQAEVLNPQIQFTNNNVTELYPTSNSVNKVNATESAWLSYSSAVKAANGSTPATYYAYLFPDTTIRIKDLTNNAYGRPGIHCIGNLFDPKFTYYNSTISLNASSVYSVDSVAMGYIYKRKSASTVYDTLMFYIYQAPTASSANLGVGYFKGTTATNYGTDTVFYRNSAYSSATNSPSVTSVTMKKIVLGPNDTTLGAFFRYKAIQTLYNVNADNIVFTAFSFKPGYTYATNDTISKDKNIFAFITSEEKGINTFPSYTVTHLPDLKGANWNQSYIVPSTVRYNNSVTGWNNYFMPSYAFTQDYGLENHLINYRITSTNVGVKEFSSNEFLLGQNIPNPFSEETSILYKLSKDAKVVKFSLYDISGRTFQNTQQANNTGHHTIKISGLASGIYFYSLNVDGVVMTKKMIVE